jgi:xanthine dehydrogenase accessory factor
MRKVFLDKILAMRESGGSAALVTDLVSGAQTIVYEHTTEGEFGLTDEALVSVREALAKDRSGMIGEAVFARIVTPAPRLFIIGAVHIAQAMAPMAVMLGYEVTIIDPRRAFATDQRFPTVILTSEWPDEALTRLKPDRRSAIVALSHDPKLDDPALHVALASPAFYIGALGSRKTTAARAARLAEQGFDEAALARIHGPVGLRIGAVSAPEIAVSILAEMTSRRRGGDL